MTAVIKENSGNGKIVHGSVLSFNYSEDATSYDPANLAGGTGDVSLTAESNDFPITSFDTTSTKLLIGNDLTVSTDSIGDVKFTVTGMNIANGVVSLSGPTIQRRLNSIKTAEAFSGTLKGAIEYYCSLVDITPVYDSPTGDLDDHLDAVDVNFIGWTGNVWDKLKELVAFQTVIDPSQIGFSHDGSYHFEMFVDTALNQLKFRRAFNYWNIVNLDDFIVDESFNVDANTTYKSATVSGNVTSLLEDPMPEYNYFLEGKLYTPIYDIGFYDAEADPAVAFKSSVDTSGLSLSAGEKIERLYQMDTHPLNGALATPVCVSTISRVPYRKARGEMVGYQYTPTYVNDVPQTYGTLRIYCDPVGYQNIPGIGEQVHYGSFVLDGSYPFDASPLVIANSQSDTTLNSNWFELDVLFTALTGPDTGAIPGGLRYETPFASGEFVVVGDGDIPIDPDEWRGLGGKLTVEQTDIPGQIKMSITAPSADQIVSADNPDTLVNGPFRVGVEVADDGEYPAMWLLASGVKHEPKSVTYVTGVDVTSTTSDEAPSVQSIFLTDDVKIHSAAMFAAQSANGPKISLSRTIDARANFGKIVGNTFIYDGNSYRIESASYSESGTSIVCRPYLSFYDHLLEYGSHTFEEFNTGASMLTFGEFSMTPLIGNDL